MEAWDIVAGEVVQLSTSAVCVLPVDVRDMALVGEESRVWPPLLPCLEADSSDPCMSKPFRISPNLPKSSI